jgi:hypothetical protein
MASSGAVGTWEVAVAAVVVVGVSEEASPAAAALRSVEHMD